MAAHHFSNQYHAPKWRAKVIPESKCFWFANGEKVCNFWELKQALKAIPSEVLETSVGHDFNHVATWVSDVVGDSTLADLLRHTDSRWGMIVNLERHMMRTLYLPHYVAKRWLNPVEQSFYLSNGRNVWSLYELRDAVSTTEDSVVEHHLQSVPNDFVNWVKNVVGDYLLADLLEGVKNKDQLLMRLSDHIVMLEESAEVHC